MLAPKLPVEFPLAGSLAWLRPEPGRDEPVQVRIKQHDARDGSVIVTAAGRVFPRETATATRRVQLAELAKTEIEAFEPPKKQHRKRSRK
jgi:hypothetical protein